VIHASVRGNDARWRKRTRRWRIEESGGREEGEEEEEEEEEEAG